jgi:integrase
LKNPEGPIFRKGDKPWTANSLDRECAKLSRKFLFRVTPYAVRHTFATEKIIQGVDLVTIATLMGHVDLKMLMKVYQHVRKRGEHLRAALRA